MKHFRINFIDGHDLRYKSFETSAAGEDAAISALWDRYDTDYDHHIVEIMELKDAPALPFRIGYVKPAKALEAI